MKKIIFAIILILLSSTCNAILKKQIKIEVKVIVSNKILYQSHFVKKCVLYPIKISLINNSNSTLKFWVMTCSWKRSFIFNSDGIAFFNLGCDKDIVDKFKLESGKTLTYNGYLRISNESKIRKNTNLKLGFVFINEKVSYSESEFFKLLLEKKNIIWCDTPLKIKL